MEDYLPIPKFSSEKLPLWFAQLESVFALNGVTCSFDKYDFVIATIPTEYTTMVEDIMLNPALETESKYDYIKHEFIKRMSIHNLKKVKMGNAKPSEYMETLTKMADRRLSIEIISNIWLNNLPERVREILSLESTGRVETRIEMADKVMALMSPVQPFQASVSIDYLKIILRRMNTLSKQVDLLKSMFEDELIKQLPGPSARVSPPDRGEATSANQHQQSSLKVTCWHHTVYGDMATSCAPRCQYYLNFSFK